MPTDKPVAELSGVELCEEAAKGMGWEFVRREPEGAYFDVPDGVWRQVIVDKIAKSDDYRYSVGVRDFRPDLDGNHFGEVKAWLFFNNATWRSDRDCFGFYAHVVLDSGASGFIYPQQIESSSEAEAFLRAFVAACRAQDPPTQEVET